MTIEEIRKNAPPQATHWRVLESGDIAYFKELELLYLYAYWHQEKWSALPYRYLDTSNIKPLY